MKTDTLSSTDILSSEAITSKTPDFEFIYDGFEVFMSKVQDNLSSDMNSGNPLFTTDVSEDLFDKYFIPNLPENKRQYYNCNCCRKFVNTYGGVVSIDESGKQKSIWPEEAGPLFSKASNAMRKIVSKSRVNGVFLSEESSWGVKRTGVWDHMSVTPIEKFVFKKSVLNASQVMAEKLQDRQTLIRGLVEFSKETVEEACILLNDGQLYRSEKCINTAMWLKDVHDQISKKTSSRDNVIWRAVATAPPGFCHVKSTMIGTLLEDIQDGKDFHTIKRNFDSKMDPSKYQRPTAPPSDGTIAQAEKIVNALASAGSFRRRFAKLEDVIAHAVWKPETTQSKNSENSENDGVFSHLKKGKPVPGAARIASPPVPMTWYKFQKTVLPTARKIELLIKPTLDSYFGMLTAEDMLAPPILQWDTEEQRNPVSCYVYVSGSLCYDWNLPQGSYVEVNAITPKPSAWNDSKNSHHGEGVFLILNDAKPKKTPDLCLFPEILKSEYHGIRSVIEAHSKSQKATGTDEASACGISITNYSFRSQRSYTLKVTSSSGSVSFYSIDRWD